MKKIIFSLLGIFLFFGSFIFVACGEEVKAEIQVNSEFFISEEGKENYLELSLNEGDAHTATITAKVLKANDGRVVISNDFEDIVTYETNYDENEDQSVITLTANNEGSAQLILNSKTGSAEPVKINVFVYSDLISLTQKNDTVGGKKTQFVEVGTELELENEKFLNMTSRKGGESNRKEITWGFNAIDSAYTELVNSAEEKVDLINSDKVVVASITKNKILKVESTYVGEKISLLAKSRYLNAQVELDVLNVAEDKFSAITYGRNNTSVGETINDSISIIRNNDSVIEKEAYLKFTVQTDYDYIITPVIYKDGKITDEYLAVTEESAVNGEFIYKVRGKKDCDPAIVEVKFIAEYVDYDKRIESSAVTFALSDVVDSIVVTSDEGIVADNSTMELYQAYANGKGKWFNVLLGPSTVLASQSKIYIEVECEAQNTEQNLNGYIKVLHNGVNLEFSKQGTVWRSVAIENNSEVYIMAGASANTNIKLKFVSEKAENINRTINFECVKAPESITINEEINKYLATDVIDSILFEVPVTGVTSARGLYLDYDKTLPIEASGITYADGKISFSLTNTQIGFVKENIKITLCHKNGMKADKAMVLNTFIPLTEVKISVDPTTLTGVSSYTLTNNSLSDIVATIGSSVKLNYNLKGTYNSLTVSDDDGEIGIEWFNKTSNILYAKESTGKVKKNFTFKFTGYDRDYKKYTETCVFTFEVYIPATTLKVEDPTIALISEDSLSVEDINKSVKHVIVNLRNDNNEVTYKELDLFKISVDRGSQVELTEGAQFEDDSYIYTVNNIKIDKNQLSFDIHAKTTKGYGISRNTLNLEYSKFNTILRLPLTLNVQNATRVSQVTWENEVDSVYIDASANIGERNYVFVTTTSPSSAYNSELRYIFVPDNGTNSDIITINKCIVSLKTAQVAGGTGYIYILPSDAIKNNGGIESVAYLEYNAEAGKYEVNNIALSELGNSYSTLVNGSAVFLAGLNEDGSKNYVSFDKIIKKIRLIVADGQTQATAYRIYSESQLKNINLSLHYVLMNNIELSNWTSLGTLKGSLSGYVEENVKDSDEKGSKSTISIKLTESNPLFEAVDVGASVSDLTLFGDVQKAFITENNRGNISNITIDVAVGTSSVTSSTVKGENIGAIVSENNGTINKAIVLGASLEGSGRIGGIAGTNKGRISNSYVELYEFTSGNSVIVGGDNSVVGGLVGYSEAGIIESSYIYDYSLAADGSSKITGETGSKVGAMIGSTSTEGASAGTLSSEIKNSFAVVNLKNYAESENANISITDAYISYYEEGIYKSDITKTDSSNWIESGEKFQGYVNEGNSHLKFYQSGIVDVASINVQNIEGKSLYVSNSSGILMKTGVTVASTALTNAEKNRLDSLNTITIAELFNVNSNDIVVTSSNKDIIEISSNALIIKNTSLSEEVTLTVYSKKDYSKSQEFKLVVINTISQFKNDINSDVLKLQVGNTTAINYSIKNAIYLGSSNVYNLVQDDYKVTGVINVPEGQTGVVVSDIDFSINGFVGTVASKKTDVVGNYSLKTTLLINGLNGDYQTTISNKFNNEITLSTFKGSRHIGVSNNQVVVYPASTSEIKIHLDTDDSEDDINFKIVKDLKNIEMSALTIKNVSSQEQVFEDSEINKIKVLKTKNNQQYILTLSIVDEYKNQIAEEETYYMIIESKRKTADNEKFVVTIKLEPQDINHIDMTSYIHKNLTSENGKTIFNRTNQISSILSPGNYAYMVVGVNPTSSYYEYFTIGAESNEGYYLNITKLKEKTIDSYEIDNSNDFSYLGNSIEVHPNFQDRPEQYIFRVYASKSIKNDCIIPLTITFYGKDKKQLDTASYSYHITYQKPAEIELNPEKNNSPILAKGGSIDVKISIGKDQTLNREDIRLSGVDKGITIGEILGPFENSDGTKYYTTSIRANLDAKVIGTSEGLGNFQICASVSRFINGVKEIEDTRSSITLVKFSLSDSTKNIEATKDAWIDFDLNYVFDPISYDENASPESERQSLESARQSFISQGYYLNANEKFSINTQKTQTGIFEGVGITERFYIVDGDSYTKVRFNESGIADCGKFKLRYVDNKLSIAGTATTDAPVTLKLVNKIYTDKNSSSYNEVSCYYNISVSIYTDEEDSLLEISSAEDFLKIPENSSAENYILTNDIELSNYTPIDTSKIEMLDGNGYSINIASFNMDGSGTIERALFSSVASNTTLKNIRVNYYYGGQIAVNVSTKTGFTDIKIAGFAINNSGIITNCEVICLPYASSSVTNTDVNNLGLNIKFVRLGNEYILPNGTDIESTIAGFVINNNGSITNSRVGGDSVLILTNDGTGATETELSVFNVIGQGKVSGFVSQNTGAITSSCVNRAQITNKSQNINFFTSGFANSNTGRISTSFVQGTETTVGTDRTSKTLCLNGTSIASNGFVAGFINSNSGNIDNSYANIAIKGLDEEENLSYYGAGFVYTNTGKIELCYASCKMEGANISQSNFSGVGIKGESLNTGTIEKCYYNAKDSNLTEDVENAMQTGAVLARNPSSETQFYGFSFASELDSNDGIWYIGSNNLLTLTEANQTTFSHREKMETTIVGQSKFPYVSINGDDDYKYGGKKNPIIIRSAEEFDMAMGNPNAGTNLKNNITGIYVRGVYRLVKDIQLSELKVNDEINLASTSKTFTGVLDGNGFTIKDIAISPIKGANTLDSVGLFSSIQNGSIYNLNLEIANVTATNSAFVGGLAGKMIGSSRLINIAVNQLTPTGTEISNNSYGVQGVNLVGGLVGAVFGEAKITNVSITNPIVQSAYYNEAHSAKKGSFYDVQDSESFNYKTVRQSLYQSNTSFLNSINKLSFAGGLFGYLDIYKTSMRDSFNMELVSDNGYNITNIKGYDCANIRGEVVGGLVGFVGITSNIKDAGFVFKTDGISSNIISYNAVAGGLFGYTVSIIKQAYAEYTANAQNDIEDNLSTYYLTGNTSVERGSMNIFIDTSTWNVGIEDSIENKPEYIGGLIGYQKYGKLIASYSKINVIANTDDCIAGGVIGRIGNPTPQSAWNQSALNSDGVTGEPTTVLLNEVYSSGDVRGKVGFKYTAGGIVGSIAGNARLTLTAVNSVNYYGIDEYNETEYTEEDNKLSLSKLGIYALVGEKEEGAKISSVLPVSQAIANSIDENASTKHIGYVSTVNYKGKQLEVLPYPGYTTSDKLSKNLIQIVSLSTINSRKTGYIEMNGYFLNSGNWSTDNWRQDITDLYPTIKFVEILDCLYLDQDNIEEVLILMQSSAKEIRVRGATSDKTSQKAIDLTEYTNLLNISNFAGRLIGGWDLNGEKDLSKRVPIILNREMFNKLGSGAVFKDLEIIYADGIDNSSYSSIDSLAVTGGAFIKEEITDCKFDNVIFDFSNVETITVNGFVQGSNAYIGLIVPTAKSTSFTNVTIKTGEGNTSKPFMNIDFSENDKNSLKNSTEGIKLYVGLLAGSIIQANQYRSMEISNVDIIAKDIQNALIAVSDPECFTGKSGSLYVGLYSGYISYSADIGNVEVESSKAPIFITTRDIYNNSTNNIIINTTIEKFDAYIGGYVGYADVESLSFSKTETEESDSLDRTFKVQINVPETNKDAYVGGMFGYLKTKSITSKEIDNSKGRNNIETTIVYNTIKPLNDSIEPLNEVAFGGLIGKLEGCGNAEIYVESITSTIQSSEIGGYVGKEIKAKEIYIAGVVGSANVSTNLNLVASSITTLIGKDGSKGAKIGKITGKTYISGVIGKLKGTSNTCIVGEVKAKIKNDSNPILIEDSNPILIERATYSGAIFGYVEGKGLSIEKSKIDFEIDISTKEKVYSGAVGGYINLSSDFALKELIQFKDNADPQKDLGYTIKSNITYSLNESPADAFIAGVVGDLIANKLVFDTSVVGVKEEINLKENSNINNLYTGVLFGSVAITEQSELATAELTLSGNIKSTSTSTSIATAYIGAVAGANSGSGALKISSNLKVKDFNVGGDFDPTEASPTTPISSGKETIDKTYSTNNFKATQGYIGGLIGKNTGTININGGTIEESTEIAVALSDTSYVGGVIGEQKGALNVGKAGSNDSTACFVNSGLFAVTNTASTHIGGFVGGVEGTGNTTFGKQASSTVAHIDANFFVNGKTINAGGIIGYVGAGSIINVKNTVFGGAFKVYGAKSNSGDHTFGGIIGSVNDTLETGTISKETGTISNNASYGDYIVTYDDNNNFTELNTLVFGGIVGHNSALTIASNYALTTCNNDRIATTDTRKAIVGSFAGSSATNEGKNNLYSHSVTLTTDDNGIDAGYFTVYTSTNRGYGTNCNTSSNLINLIKIPGTTFAKGHKLNPIKIGGTDSDTTGGDYTYNVLESSDDYDATKVKTHLNGVTYYVLSKDNTSANQINVKAVSETGKLAIIGDTREVTFGTSNSKKRTSYINKTLGQNDIISSLRLTVNIDTDSGVNGGLVTTMTGGTIYAVAVLGEMSIGGSTNINIAPVVGAMKAGLIDESMSAVNIIYRAGYEDEEGKEIGQVAGFAIINDANGETQKPTFIRNSYSTGKVTTYNKAKAYGFIDGNGQKDGTTYKGYAIKVINCYTISQLDINDYVSDSPAEAKPFGCATYVDCWYDVNATECKQPKQEDTGYKVDASEKTTVDVAVNYAKNSVSTGFSDSTGWEQSADFNFGYATRKFGYLKQSSYASQSSNASNDAVKDRNGLTLNTYTQKNWNESTMGGNDFWIVPNACKLKQMSSALDSRFVLWNDLELTSAGLTTMGSLGPFTGTFDGQEHVIDYGLNDASTSGSNPLFSTISGSVSNLSLTNICIKNTGSAGALASELTSGTIYNIVASGFITDSKAIGDPALGGIIGNAKGGTISYCKNYVKINASKPGHIVKVGGIIGAAWTDDQSVSVNPVVTIENCINYAPIQGDSYGNNSENTIVAGEAGGIVGLAHIQVNISNCGNTNSVISGYVIKSENEQKSMAISFYAGGIVGRLSNTSSTVKNCYNTAMIKAGNKSNTVASYAGGIVGYSKTLSSGSGYLYNSGVIEALGENFKDIKMTGNEDQDTYRYIENLDNFEINVYADGIIGNGISISSYKNTGTIIRNGIYENKFQPFYWNWGETKTSGPSGLTFSVSKREAHITGYDDLGYPTSFCVTAKRSIKIDGTDAYIVQNQTIISPTVQVYYNDTNKKTYYENGKTTGSQGNYANYSDLMSTSDKNSYGMNTVTINGGSYALVRDSVGFMTAVNNSLNIAYYHINQTDIDQDKLSAGYTYDVDVTSNNTDNIKIISSKLIKGAQIPANGNVIGGYYEDDYYIQIYYTGTTDNASSTFTYTLTASKPDKVNSVTVKATNIFKEGDNLKLYVGNQSYAGYFEENKDYDVEINNEASIGKYSNGYITITDYFDGKSLTLSDVKDYIIKIYYRTAETSMSHIVETVVNTIKISKENTINYKSENYTTGGQYATLAHFANDYIKYSINDNSNDSKISYDGIYYLYETGTYGNTKIKDIDFPSSGYWTNNGIGPAGLTEGTIINDSIRCYYYIGKAINTTITGGTISSPTSVDKPGSVVFYIGVYDASAWWLTDNIPVYVRWDREEGYGDYITLDTTVGKDQNATYSNTGEQKNTKYYTNNETINGVSYQTWYNTSSKTGYLTNYSGTQTFTKSANSMALYVISDNYGNKTMYLDTSNGTSYDMSYNFDYNGINASSEDIVITCKKIEDVNIASEISYLDVYEEIVGTGTTIDINVIDNQLVLTREIKGSDGTITIGDTTYSYNIDVNTQVLTLTYGEKIITGSDGIITIADTIYSYSVDDDTQVLTLVEYIQGSDGKISINKKEYIYVLNEGKLVITALYGSITISEVTYSYNIDIDTQALTLTSGETEIQGSDGKITINGKEYIYVLNEGKLIINDSTDPAKTYEGTEKTEEGTTQSGVTIEGTKYDVYIEQLPSSLNTSLQNSASGNADPFKINIAGEEYKFTYSEAKLSCISHDNPVVVIDDVNPIITINNTKYLYSIVGEEGNYTLRLFEFVTYQATANKNQFEVTIENEKYSFTYNNETLSSSTAIVNGKTIITKNGRFYWEIKNADNKYELILKALKFEFVGDYAYFQNYITNIKAEGLKTEPGDFGVIYEQTSYIIEYYSHKGSITVQDDEGTIINSSEIYNENSSEQKLIFNPTSVEDQEYVVTINYATHDDSASSVIDASDIDAKIITIARTTRTNYSYNIDVNTQAPTLTSEGTTITGSNGTITIAGTTYSYNVVDTQVLILTSEGTTIIGSNGILIYKMGATTYTGIILQGDVNLGSDNTIESLSSNIYGNNHFLNFSERESLITNLTLTSGETTITGSGGTITIAGTTYSYNIDVNTQTLTLTYNLITRTGSGGTITIAGKTYSFNIDSNTISDINLAGVFKSKLFNSDNVTENNVTENNVTVFGTTLDLSKTPPFGIQVKNSFINFNEFSDAYESNNDNNAITDLQMNNNYGLIVGFDGADGDAGVSGIAGAQGNKGLSFDLTATINKGIIKAGNGGNGGRGSDGTIGQDSQTAKAPTKGTAGTSGGDAGRGGTVKTKGKWLSSTGEAIAPNYNGNPGQAGFSGNKGHSGVLLTKFTVNFTDELGISDSSNPLKGVWSTDGQVVALTDSGYGATIKENLTMTKLRRSAWLEKYYKSWKYIDGQPIRYAALLGHFNYENYKYYEATEGAGGKNTYHSVDYRTWVNIRVDDDENDDTIQWNFKDAGKDWIAPVKIFMYVNQGATDSNIFYCNYEKEWKEAKTDSSNGRQRLYISITNGRTDNEVTWPWKKYGGYQRSADLTYYTLLGNVEDAKVDGNVDQKINYEVNASVGTQRQAS